ncbi:MAG: Serine protease Do-like HtrA [Opitutia bacterium UBA7350]|nr:MAG: Serine protease Do-like HtrA [Opitutae bacterium UBA7350]
MLRFRNKIFLLCVLISSFLQANEAERAVVKIINFSQLPDWQEPWKFSQVTPGAGSGFVIKGNRIMTNAHVVSWSRQLLVFRYQDPQPYRASIEFIGHDCDLAVLKVDDPAFFEGLTPLEIGELPAVRSSVTTYGYPAGGQQISYTSGVISRIEIQRYSHIFNRHFLTLQTDAALNPGNSGGPAIQDGFVVGVSFQGNPELENAGFIIPPEIIHHFLKDIEDGYYHGFPDAGFNVASLHNPAFREYLQLPNGEGARIDYILEPYPETRQLIKENDVLLEIDGYSVGSDGMILYKGNRMQASVLFDNAQHQEKVPVKIWRDGTEQSIDLPVFANTEDRLSGRQYDTPPPYLMIGGLVFTELSLDFLRDLDRDQRSNDAELLYQLFYRNLQDEDSSRAKPILLSSKLNHPGNIDLRIPKRLILTHLNDQPIQSMQDLQAALQSPVDGFHLFVFSNHMMEALEVENADAIDQALLKAYQIPATCRIHDHE